MKTFCADPTPFKGARHVESYCDQEHLDDGARVVPRHEELTQIGVLLVNSDLDDIYPISDIKIARKAAYYKRGTPDAHDNSLDLVWSINAHIYINALDDGTPAWVLFDEGGAAIVYGLDDVATPDLVSVWIAADDGSPTRMTVTTISR